MDKGLIQQIQVDTNEGRLKASDIVPKLPRLNERKDAEFFTAWRVHLIDRMMEEYDRNHWDDYTSNPTPE